MFITNKNINPYSFRSLSTEITNNTKHSSIEKNKNQKNKKLKNLKSLIIKNNNMKKFNRFSLVDKLVYKTNESPFESDEKTTVLYIGCMGESGLIHHSAKVATGDRPMVRIHLHPLKT